MAVLKFQGKVLRNEYITPTVFEIDFELTQELKFEAGQFVMIKFKDPENPEKNVSRAYSVASSPESSTLRLCVKLVEGGKGTNFLNNLEVNDIIDMSGPYGKFVYKTHKPRFPFFICTGTGIAPYLSMLDSKHFQEHLPSRAICILGVRTQDEILYQFEFSKHPFVEFVPTVSQPTPGWQGFKGRVTHYLNELPNNFDWSLADYYLCGSGDMIKQTKEFLLHRGVSKEHIYQEIYFT